MRYVVVIATRPGCSMSFAATIFLAFAMSTDAFAASIGKGATLHKPRFADAIRIGALFGVIEATTPIIGWALGIMAASYISAWDHWIAFTMLFCLGAAMIWRSFSNAEPEPPRPASKSVRTLALTAVATSIDAMAIGVSLAFLDAPILPAALAIGIATTLMTTIGVMLGRALGALAGRRAEFLGGLVLIGIGAAILYSHLHASAV